MAAMEPIVVALEIDEFMVGSSKIATSWPTGTLLHIQKIKDNGNDVRRPDGRIKVRAYPLGLTARDGLINGIGEYVQHTLTTSPVRALPFGRFIHAPNASGKIRGNENVIYFTPPTRGPDESRFAILADPCTVGGPGDEIYDSPYNDARDTLVCGPKFISAAVGGVCALDWDTSKYSPELKNDQDLETAYAGAPVFITMRLTRDRN